MRILLLVAVAASCLPVSVRGLDWEQGAGVRRAILKVSSAAKAGFTSMLPSSTGIHFTNSLPYERYKTNQILLNGSGVAAGDVDGDGWCDLYFCRLEGDNVLYRNLGGWRFEDVTSSAGVACPNMDATGAALVDLDGDGDLDLVVNTLGSGTHVFLNDGKGHFTKLNPVLNPGRGGTSLALGDLDGDGFLDLYVANYRTSALMDMPNTRFILKRIGGKQVVSTVNGRPVTDPEFLDRFIVNERGGIEEMGEPDVLYRNIGGTNFLPRPFNDGSFLDDDGKALSRAPLAWGLSVAIRDLNQDGLPDIYVCNDFDSPDEIWINQGGGKFRALEHLAMRKSSVFSMGVDFADINRDGYDEFLVLDMLARDRVTRLTTAADRNAPIAVPGKFDNRASYMMNTLHLNRGDGTYAEIANLSGLAASDWSWAVSFLDVDLDGWEDVLISNGNERASRHMDIADRLQKFRTEKERSNAEILDARKIFPRLATPNLAFRNRHDLTFERVNWGFDYVGVSHGIALADLDNDGDLDVIVNNLNGAAGIYRNDTSAARIAVRLHGKAPNTFGIGARIEVLGGPVTQSQEIMCGGKYASSDEPIRVFAAGQSTNLTIHVKWLGGKETIVSNAQPNYAYEISDEQARVPRPGSVSNTATLFTDVSDLLKHTHIDAEFDDFARQPMLPIKLSQLGPGVSWADVDGDDRDDLIVSTGRGGQCGVLLNKAGDAFEHVTSSPLNQNTDRDQTCLLPWRKSPSELVLLAGWSNYETGATDNCTRVYNLAAKRVEDNFPKSDSTAGPLAMADVDGDGNLDLFVGGRCVPGKYPVVPRSLLLHNNGGRFEIDVTNSQAVANIGMVSGAVFSDIDGDNDADLLLACDWGPVRIFRNEGGRFTPWNPPVTFNSQSSTLNSFTGWWNGIATGDFDGDGRLDIVASNWGRNTVYQGYRSKPLQVFYGDVGDNGMFEAIITYFDEQTGQQVPFRGLDYLGKALPFLRERFKTHEAFAKASLKEIFPNFACQPLEAAWLDSTVFLNRGDRFEAIPLPVEAQIAPAFGISIADFNGDGFEDIFLAQNFFALPREVPRMDAGLGLILLGKGDGTFKALSARESGIRIYGEQRGSATADFDGDGRVDLAVGQNATATKLFRNASARPGLRVRLTGSLQNPNGIGAAIRIGDEQGWGPVRELHLGAGYWSSDSPVQAMSFQRNPTRIEVRWPGGRISKENIPADAKNITVALDAK
jgi:hypothetical protein